jgi:hypothetical protein
MLEVENLQETAAGCGVAEIIVREAVLTQFNHPKLHLFDF